MPTPRIRTKALGELACGVRGAPPRLWIHAFPLAGGMWRDAVALLGGRTHLFPDLPGFGRTGAVDGALTMDLAAEGLIELLDAFGAERAVVGGCSMGGYIALAFARRSPERLAGLVLADTRAGADDEAAREKREVQARAALTDGVAPLRDALLPKLVVQPQGPHGQRAARLIDSASRAGVASALRGMALREDQAPHLASIACPTLVVVGERDELTPPVHAEALAAGIPGASLEVLSGAGHLAPLEAPERFAEVVDRWERSAGLLG